MGATKIFNLSLKVNDKEAKTTLNSVGKDLKSLRSYTRNLEEGTDKWRAANKKLAEAEKTYDGMKKRQREFINQTKEASDATGDNKKAIQDFGQSFGQVTSGIMSGDLVQVQAGLVGLKNGIFAATKASLAFIATPLGAVLAALAVTIGAVTAYFKDSEEGQNAWNKITAVTSALVGNFTDLLSDLGRMIFKTFSDPKKAMQDFAQSIKENIVNRVEGVMKLFPRLGEVIDLVLSGKFTEAGKVATDAIGQIATGVENVTDKVVQKFNAAGKAVNEFGQEIQNEVKRAGELADLEAKADKIERGLIVERGKVEAEVAERRLKSREEDKYTAAQRKKFLEEAVEMERGLINKEIQAASIRRDIKTEQNSFSKSSKEDLNEEANLIAAVSALERKRADAARTLQRDLLRVDGQVKKAAGGGGSSKADPAIAEKLKNLEALDKLEAEYFKKQEDREADSELKKAVLEQQRALNKAKALGAEKALLDTIEAEHKIKIDEAKTAEEEEKLQKLREFEAKKRELENELEISAAESDKEKAAIKAEQDLEKEELAYEKKLEDFEKEMEFLQLTEEEKNQVLEALKKAHENVILGIQKKATDEKIADEKRLNEAKKQLWNDSLNAAINLAGQETKVGQALLIAKQFMALRETAIQLGLFQNKVALNAAGATTDIAAGTAKTASVGFPQNIPLLIGFAAQVAGIIGAVKSAATAKGKVKTSFARGGFTDLFGMGYKDQTGHEVAGDVHVGEYVVPKIVREDPEVPQILNYLESKRKKALGLYADGGDASNNTMNNSSGAQIGNEASVNSEGMFMIIAQKLLNKLEAPLVVENYFGFEAEEKRQETQKKLDEIKNRSQVKTS